MAYGSQQKLQVNLEYPQVQIELQWPSSQTLDFRPGWATFRHLGGARA